MNVDNVHNSMLKSTFADRSQNTVSSKTTMARLGILLILVTLLMGSSIFFADALLQPDFANLRTRKARITRVLFSNRRFNPGEIRISTALSAEDGAPKKIGKKEGVYVRPSGAIEKGSGFFVPGLEGPKVRLVIGGVLLGATAVNHVLLGGVGSFGDEAKEQLLTSTFLSFSETTAVVYSLLLLFQSAIEYAKEALPEASGDATNNKSTIIADNTEVLEQKWSSKSIEEAYRSSVQWASASFLSMTPTTQILLLTKEDGIRYRLGSATSDVEDAISGVSAALEELSKSKGGRIALPLTHPAATSLLGTSNDDSSKLRTVILQRITDDSCFMVSSDQLLAGYTGGDLKWLGKLAGYVADSE